MDIVLDYTAPLKEGVVGSFVEETGLTREPPLECFSGQMFTQLAAGGSIRVAVTAGRSRILVSTNYMLAHLRSFQLLILAKHAACLGEKPKLTFSQEFAHMDLAHWFPEGIQKKNQIQM